MKLGVIADDFTGASDIALTLCSAGMRTVQYVGTPKETAKAEVAAGVVALKSRTLPAERAVSLALEACDWLRAQGATQIIFKICSTFDSTPKGNIGPVTEALANRLGAKHVIVCPAFPETGRSVYNGHLFVNDVLLSESGMQNHPLTPMSDPDLRRVLAAQSTWDVGHIPASTVARGPAAIIAALKGPPALMITDAIADQDLLSIGRAAKDQKLLTGGSGIALGLPSNFADISPPIEWPGFTGKGVVLSGSCSIATREQVKTYRKLAPSFEITADAAMKGNIDPVVLADWAISQDTPPLVFSSADPENVRKAQDDFGAEQVAERIEDLFRSLSRLLVARGTERIVAAGGETSGAVIEGLNAVSLEIGPKIAAGVPALRVDQGNLGVALKSGNFGQPDFFAKALGILERDA